MPADFCAPNRDRGSVSVIVALSLLPITALFAVVVDGGRNFVERQRVQDAVESAVVESARTWATGGTACSENSAALITASLPEAETECVTSAGVVTVSASTTVPVTFLTLLGRETTEASSTASAAVGPTRATSGIRPLALCADHPAVVAWRASSASQSPVVTIGVEAGDGESCADSVPGNWALLDLDGGSNSNADLQRWIDGGFDGDVAVGDTVGGDPGIPTPAIGIDSIIGSQVTLPIYDNARAGGNGALFDVVGFAVVEIVTTRLTGAADQRSLDLRFHAGVLAGTPGPISQPSFGSTSWQVCAFDGEGHCS